MSRPVGDKPSLKEAWSGSCDQLYNFTPHEIYSEWLKQQTSNFVHGLATRSTNQFEYHTPRNIFGTAKASVVKFCVLASYIKC